MDLKKFDSFREKDLEPIKSFKIKDNLNDKIWSDFQIDNDIRENLIQIGRDFFESIELKCEINDIILCGSLCNYNWSEKYSDYDLHIIIKYSDVDENYELVEKLCNYAKKQWNLSHDIFIKGYEVEVAVQDKNDLKSGMSSDSMGGVFSLIKNKWLKKPEKKEFIPDEDTIRKKAIEIMDVVDDIEKKLKKGNFISSKKKVDKIWKKIKNQRKSGLEEGGEYSTGNLVFKLLRRNNYISKVMNLKKTVYDRQFEKYNQIKEWYDETILNFLYELDKIKIRWDIESYEGNSKYLSYEFFEDECKIELEFGYSTYSDGSSVVAQIDFSDIEYITTKINSEIYDSYGSGENNKEIKSYSFKELLDKLKEDYL